jgi:ABC-type transport system substrate-binding protein
LAETFFAMNLSAPPLDNADLRRAVLHAVDRDALARDALGGSPRLDGIVPEAVPGGVADACGDACTFDTDAAKALVAAAYPDGNVPTVVVSVYDDPTQQALADGMKAGLDAAGIPNEVQVKPFEEYRSFVVSGQQQLFSYGWVAAAPEAEFILGPLFLSGSPDNITGYANPAFDLALVNTRGNADRAARLARYGDLETQVLADAPVIPLASVGSRVVARGSVQSVAGRLDGTFDVTTVWVR